MVAEKKGVSDGQQKNGTTEHEHQRPVPAIKRAQKCRIKMLDGTEMEIIVDRNCTGKELFETVASKLNLNEKDYFSLSHLDKENKQNWLYADKAVNKQVHRRPWELSFEVKFYPPEPSTLSEDLTRYQLCLQVQKDVVSGKLPTSFATQALLGSYMVQSIAGDYDSMQHGIPESYLTDFCFAPRQDSKLLDKVHELHKTHKGQTAAEADLHYLENAKKLTMYGVDIHPAKDANNTDILLGVCSTGLLVYQDQIRVNRFAWPKILKIAFRGSNFKVKIRPGEFEKYATDVWFKLANYRAAKRLWKSCVEHHTFFRLMQPEEKPKSGLLRWGSTRFRYSGRTQFQSRMASQMVDRPVPVVQRSQSARFGSQSMENMPPVVEEKRTVELAHPLHYMDSGSRDALGQKSPSTPRDDQSLSTSPKKEYYHLAPEKTPSEPTTGRESEIVIVPVKRERKSSSSSSSSSSDDSRKKEKRNTELLRRASRSSASSKEGVKYVNKDENESPTTKKKVVAISAPESKDEKKQRKEHEREEKKREKEEKERKKKEEKERQKREKEEKKHKKKPETAAVMVVEERKKRESESSSSSSSSSGDVEKKERKMKKGKKDKREPIAVSVPVPPVQNEQFVIQREAPLAAGSPTREQIILSPQQTAERVLYLQEEKIPINEDILVLQPEAGGSPTKQQVFVVHRDTRPPGSPVKEEVGLDQSALAPSTPDKEQIVFVETQSPHVVHEVLTVEPESPHITHVSDKHVVVGTPVREVIQLRSDNLESVPVSDGPEVSLDRSALAPSTPEKEQVVFVEARSPHVVHEVLTVERESPRITHVSDKHVVVGTPVREVIQLRSDNLETVPVSDGSEVSLDRSALAPSTPDKAQVVFMETQSPHVVREMLTFEPKSTHITHVSDMHVVVGTPVQEVIHLRSDNLETCPEQGVVVTSEGPSGETIERRWEETSEGPVEISTETLEDGTVVTRRRQVQKTTTTIQRQHFETFSMPGEDGAMPPEAMVHASRQVYSPAGEPQVQAVSEVPVVQTTSRTVAYETNAAATGGDPSGAEFVSSRTVESGNRTVETVTYKTEKDGQVETHVEHRIMIHSPDDIDHDEELSAAIMEATKMNPDMTVEKIEVKQESQC